MLLPARNQGARGGNTAPVQLANYLCHSRRDAALPFGWCDSAPLAGSRVQRGCLTCLLGRPPACQSPFFRARPLFSSLGRSALATQARLSAAPGASKPYTRCEQFAVSSGGCHDLDRAPMGPGPTIIHRSGRRPSRSGSRWRTERLRSAVRAGPHREVRPGPQRPALAPALALARLKGRAPRRRARVRWLTTTGPSANFQCFHMLRAKGAHPRSDDAEKDARCSARSKADSSSSS